MNTEKILIVEDEENERTGLAELISAWGYRTEIAGDGVEGLEKIESFTPGIVVTDLKMPRMDGMELLEHISEHPAEIAVILLTAQGSIDAAVAAMKLGAYDFIEKPVNPTRLRNILQNAARQRGTDRELEVTRRMLRDTGQLGLLVGSSKKMQEVFHLVELVAPSTASVLITGESGTGKELLARTIHELSPRKSKPFVAINCAAIPETLIESEIFGHEKGAFTGASDRRIGRFELANGSSIFLDEVSELPLDTQTKLLRVLQEGEFEPVGSSKTIKVDVRVITASNRDLQQDVASGRFRADLFYRLNVFPIDVPPLRARQDDIRELAEFFMQRFARKLGKPLKRIHPDALAKLNAHSWPGNIRDLQNTIERAAITSTGDALMIDWPLAVATNHGCFHAVAAAKAPEGFTAEKSNGSLSLEEIERQHFITVLKQTRGVIEGPNGAARLLNLKPSTTRFRIKKLGIKKQQYDAGS